jgi:hypothetical protein
MVEKRKYLPTLADLLDRLSIVQLKAIHILENRDAYLREMDDIRHDIDLLLGERQLLNSEVLHAIQVLMLANVTIWNNESRARAGGAEQDELLKFTHSVNGIRTRAKNVIARETGERVDPKVDCLAADLPVEYGNWDVFGGTR